MSDFVIVAGSFKAGNGSYIDGVFYLPKKQKRSVVCVVNVELNATVVQNSAMRALGSGVKNAVVLGPVIMIAGAFAFPAAAIGTVGIAAAAIAAAIGLMGGGAENKALLQVVFDDGAGFVAVCHTDLADQIRNDRLVAMANVELLPKPMVDVTPVKQAPVALAAPTTSADTPRDEGLLDGATAALSSGAEAVGQAASTAISSTVEAASDAGAWIRGKLFGR